VTYDEMEKGTYERLPEGTSYKGIIAEVAAKLGMDALDANRDGSIAAEELEAVASEVDLIAGAAPSGTAVVNADTPSATETDGQSVSRTASDEEVSS
jgi:hypothetical protein